MARDADARAASAEASVPVIPSVPAARRSGGTSRWEPTLIRVGASSGPTSEKRKSMSMSRARPRDETFTRHWLKSPASASASAGGKLLSMCQPVSPGSAGWGKRTTK